MPIIFQRNNKSGFYCWIKYSFVCKKMKWLLSRLVLNVVVFLNSIKSLIVSLQSCFFNFSNVHYRIFPEYCWFLYYFSLIKNDSFNVCSNLIHKYILFGVPEIWVPNLEKKEDGKNNIVWNHLLQMPKLLIVNYSLVKLYSTSIYSTNNKPYSAMERRRQQLVLYI